MLIAKLKYHNGSTFTSRNEQDGTPDPKRRKRLVESAGVAFSNSESAIAYIKALSPAALAYVETVEVYSCAKPHNEWMAEVQEHSLVGYGMRLEGSYRVRGNKVEVA